MINRRYSVLKKLGQGRSSVYLCEDAEQTGKYFALKILPAETDIEEQNLFKAEFYTIQNLDHTNIIQAYERGTIVEVSENESITIGSKYLAMEYFDGNELLSFVMDDENFLREIIAQICSVLFYLHQSNYIYYDLKPENILVTKINDKPFIKLIDLGFARSRSEINSRDMIGTAEYLAPEILKKEPHDHRVDLYSFGILLYRLIYKKFPFQSQNHLEIYKEHIETEFIFPETKYSSELINVVKKLLHKNPADRFFNSVQVLYDLHIPITEDLYQYWVPIKIFSDRTDILNIVNRYVTTASSGEIIVIRGFEKSGKSAVSQELYSRYDNFILLSNDRTKSGTQLIKFFLNKLLFNEFIFHELPADILELADKIFTNQSSNIISDLKLIVNKASQINKFILLIDDFNLYDNFALEIFKETFPILQVNGSNVILTEKSESEYVTSAISNLVELNLSSFTTAQAEELIEKTYADLFPVKEVSQLVMQYADFLPGNIFEFLKDIVHLRIVQFDYDGIQVVSDESSEKTLKNLFQEIFKIRYKSLSKEEIKVAELLSSFEILPENKELVQLSNFTELNFVKNVEELKRKHIFHTQAQSVPMFTSDGIKNFIYSQIPDKKKHHEKIAETIKQINPLFSKVELARQYQICEKIDESYSLLLSEAEDAEKISALKYEQNILEQLSKLSLNKQQSFKVKFKLCLLYHILNIYKSAHDLVEELLKEKLEEYEKRELLIIKGNSLIRLGEVEEGKEILKLLLPNMTDEVKKIKLMIDIAYAELDTNNFESALELSHIIISHPSASHENLGNCYNLLGLIAFYQKNDLSLAQINFEKCLAEYKMADSPQLIAAIEGNIGNIYNMRGDYEKVEKHWNRSLEISSSLGNIFHQGQILLNFGIYFFNKQSFENSVKNYERAALIFNSIGDKLGHGRSQVNLGEVYLFICEYQNAIDVVENAIEIYNKIQNSLEEAEAIFLLAKVHSKVGYASEFNKNIKGLENLVKISGSPEKVKLHLDFLNCIKQFEIEKELDVSRLIRISEEYHSQEDRINYFESINLIINYYLVKGELKTAFDLLSDKRFSEICDSNVYMEAEKLYLFGKAASQKSTLNLESPIFYFQKAFELLANLNLTETTSRIIYELSSIFFERGNILKAKEFASYGRSLINFKADQFKDLRVRNIYLNNPSRKTFWEKFTEILNNQ